MMTSDGISTQRLTKVDDLIRPDHSYLTDANTCFFIGEYTARQGYVYRDTNQLIINFKKPMNRLGLPEWHCKAQAIQKAATAFRNALSPNAIKTFTFVPIPPSKTREDPLHDDRMLRMLRAIQPNQQLDIRELIFQTMGTDAAHAHDMRPTPDEIRAIYGIDERLAELEPEHFALVDDVLTTGAHFKAAKSVLSASFPRKDVVGFFIARRAPNTSEIE